jgi:hypothetical protein
MSSGPVLYEGYAYSERAYVLRCSAQEHVEFALKPRNPVINPVFIVNGWKAGDAKVDFSGAAGAAQSTSCAISGDDLLVLARGRFDKETHVRIRSA